MAGMAWQYARLAEVLVWMNGPFGVGKTTTAERIREHDPRWRIFDPEHVGYLLRANLVGVTFDDFQDLPAWRRLVPAFAAEVMNQTSDDLIAAQTVLNKQYWRELRSGLAERGITVVHVVLDSDPETLRNRIIADQKESTAVDWRLDPISAYVEARSWLVADPNLVIDTVTVTPDAIVDAVLAAAE
jgi:AAA domain